MFTSYRGNFKPTLGLTVKRFYRALVQALYSIIAEFRAARQSTTTIGTIPHMCIEIGTVQLFSHGLNLASGIPMTKTSTAPIISVS